MEEIYIKKENGVAVKLGLGPLDISKALAETMVEISAGMLENLSVSKKEIAKNQIIKFIEAEFKKYNM